MFTLSNGQTKLTNEINFKWEKTDSVAKTKSQIYSDTKMFIAEYWKSAQNVIQNDDKEAGVILVKGLCTITTSAWVNDYTYNVTFKMKENKYKIILDNVYAGKAHLKDALALADEPDNKEQNELLKQDLQSIVDSYEEYIKKPSVSNGDW